MTDNDYKFKYVKGLIGPAEYLRHEMSGFECNFPNSRFEKVQKWLVKTLEDAFWELNKLSRKHPFFHNTNKLPTSSKVSQYSAYRLERGERKGVCAQILIARGFFNGSGFLELELWSHLKNATGIDCEILIMMSWLDSGYWWEHYNVAPLVNILVELVLTKESLPYLDRLGKFGKYEKEWVERVKSCLKR